MEKTNEIHTIAGKRVEVMYSGDVKDCCCRCPFSSDDACSVLDEQYVIPCRKYDKAGKYAYFVRAEEIEGTPKEVTLIPSNEDADKAAEKYGKEHTILPDDYNDGDIPVYEGWTAEAFKAGVAYERERLMKEAHDGMIERDCGGQVMLDVPDIWEHGEYTPLNQHKYPDMKPGERRRVKVLIVENE